jgi:hypothetical protein
MTARAKSHTAGEPDTGAVAESAAEPVDPRTTDDGSVVAEPHLTGEDDVVAEADVADEGPVVDDGDVADEAPVVDDGGVANDEAISDGDAVAGELTSPDAGGSRADRWPLVVTVLVAALAVLGAAAAVLGTLVADAADRDDRRDTAVATAEEVATGLLRLDFQSSPETIDRILGVSTGPLREQLTALSPTLNSLLDQGQVSSDGTVTASGVETIDDMSAQVLIAAEATVRNSELPDGQLRTYRMVVTVQREGDQWLASAVDFVA